ncbi:7,8-didemethyl-8-hydroxy-5-deazariboflavin synthase CofG [Agromyces mediolanus]|uniref:7,8-didemethyl-8-hydroxy-5-deazariboflavin synthase CofG n=1 Tax=Agromyces mediolanus TaxID=41986 RepID=UPI0038338A1B
MSLQLPRPATRSTELDRALERLDPARTPSRTDAETLLAARGDDLDRLLAVAGAVRDLGLADAGRPGVVTYSRKLFVPLTRLCRDRCHYCVFVMTPRQLARAGETMFLDEERVLEIARAGAELGCKEALLTLGDRPEDRWPEAREWLDAHGYASTLDYVASIARRILDETGLLPHLNPGVMSWAELQRLRAVAPSMGMMLETTSRRLWETRGAAHFGSPDKDPALRLRVIEDAGRARIPFTTGVLLGIGETPSERIDAVLALRSLHDRFGHIQEVIVQNFRAKPATAMRDTADLATQEYAAAVAVTRLLLGPSARLQAPPNLTDESELALLLRAGVDDWGGVSPLTPDHVNPERPWPQIEELARLTARAGFVLRERLTAHPEFVRAGGTAPRPSDRSSDDWIDDRLAPVVHRAATASGLARRDAWLDAVLRRARTDPAGLEDADYLALLHAEGDDLDALAELADEVRRAAVGTEVSYVVNQNLAPDAPWSAEGLSRAVSDAVANGVTEVCAQGVVAGGDEEWFVRAVKRGGPVHLHAFRPGELVDGARRAGVGTETWVRRLQQAGLDTVPGTGALILDDGVRSALSGGRAIPSAEWERVVRTAHGVGLRSTATMVFGHLESPAQQLAHLRRIAAIQRDTGGFTEFIPMPWVPADSPVEVPGARPGPTGREVRAVVAVSRLVLAGSIDHVQAAWPKLGFRWTQQVLAGGADDLGGLLVPGASRSAPETGRALTVDDARALAAGVGRTLRERRTDYSPR